MTLPRHQHLKLTTFVSDPTGTTSNHTLTVFRLDPPSLGNALAHTLVGLNCNQFAALAVAARELAEVIDPGTEDGGASQGPAHAFVQAAMEYALWLDARERERKETPPDATP